MGKTAFKESANAIKKRDIEGQLSTKGEQPLLAPSDELSFNGKSTRYYVVPRGICCVVLSNPRISPLFFQVVRKSMRMLCWPFCWLFTRPTKSIEAC